MRKKIYILCILIVVLLQSACSLDDSKSENDSIKVGIMLSDAGLGDQSFSDLGFSGLEKARDELNISFDYREIKDTETYEKGLEELVEQGNDLIIGLGFSVQEDLETVAKKYPKNNFILVDANSKLPNVYNVTFKEEEASYLLGVIAGMKTSSNVVGFVGGEDNSLIKKFETGFTKGVNSVNKDATVLIKYANTFGDDKLGIEIAKSMINEKADFIYPAAGFTGVGVILESQREGTYSFGVDSDQFYLAEKSIVTSMLKNVDSAVYDIVKEFVENGEIKTKDRLLGLSEKGVDLAPIRVLELTKSELDTLEQLRKEISNGTITINE